MLFAAEKDAAAKPLRKKTGPVRFYSKLIQWDA